MHRKAILPVFIIALAFLSANKKPIFSYKTHGNVANYFESEQAFRTFFDFHSGEVVAEIGAGNGNNLRGFNSISHGITFYLQDIGANTCTQKVFNKAVSLGTNAAENRFHCVIGAERESKLPDNSFDKICLISTFHEFIYMDEMMADIHKKLKPNGKLYILESHCYTRSHKNYKAEETIRIAEKHHFILVEKYAENINNASGMYRTIFRKK